MAAWLKIALALGLAYLETLFIHGLLVVLLAAYTGLSVGSSHFRIGRK